MRYTTSTQILVTCECIDDEENFLVRQIDIIADIAQNIEHIVTSIFTSQLF